MKKIKRQKNQLPLVLIVSAILIVLIGLTVYAYSNKLWFFSEKTTQTTNPTSTSIDTEVENSVKEGNGSGQGDTNTSNAGVTDTKGETEITGEGISSTSGDIVLYSPAANQSIKGSIAVSGKANTSTIYYRVNDNLRGMIGNGQLEVVKGKFSGTLSVTTAAKDGTFEVYSFNNAGQEINNITVEVAYQ